EDLVREMDQLLVLPILFLHGLPLLVGDHLALGVGSVLADQHEGREEDRLEGDDHRQQAVRVVLDSEPDPEAEPEDVDVDEQHRARKGSDRIGDPVLHALRPLLSVFEQHRVRVPRYVPYVLEKRGLLHGQTAPFRRFRARTRSYSGAERLRWRRARPGDRVTTCFRSRTESRRAASRSSTSRSSSPTSRSGSSTSSRTSSVRSSMRPSIRARSTAPATALSPGASAGSRPWSCTEAGTPSSANCHSSPS